MTDAERRAALVEKVARSMISPKADPSDWRFWTEEATAAVTVALEEAARVCDPKGNCSEMDKYGEHYAAAIRELIPRESV